MVLAQSKRYNLINTQRSKNDWKLTKKSSFHEQILMYTRN